MGNARIIRKFEWKDIAEVMRIEQESFGSDRWDEMEFMKWFELFPEGFLVAENEASGLAGYVICDRDGYVHSIAVRNTEQRKGIGKALICEETGIIDADELCLHVRISNENAIRFYEKLGFQKTQVFSGIYPDGEDALHMKLSWKQAKLDVPQE